MMENIKSNGNFIVTNNINEMSKFLCEIKKISQCEIYHCIKSMITFNGAKYIVVVDDNFKNICVVSESFFDNYYDMRICNFDGDEICYEMYSPNEIECLISDVFDDGLHQTDDNLITLDDFYNLF